MMSMESETAPSTDVPVGSAVYAKYGEASIAGFQAVPDLLLKHQRELGLSPTDLAVLLNVLMHWWYPEKKPFPRSTTIAKRMGVTPRTVQRSLQQLEELGWPAALRGNRADSALGAAGLRPEWVRAPHPQLLPRRSVL